LTQLIGIDQTGLIPCDDLKNQLRNLVKFKPSQTVINTLNNLPTASKNIIMPEDWNIHDLAEARGTVVNLDYFSTFIEQLPPGFTPESMTEHLRQNLNRLTPSTNFIPHPSLPRSSFNAEKWASGQLGAVILIEINPDKGSVILSYKTDRSWRFSTIYDPFKAYNHPVSGTREFGIRNSGNGFEFYTSGADRLTLSIDQLANELSKLNPNLADGIAFSEADKLWNDFMNNVAEEINRLGGKASKGASIGHRPNWKDVKSSLDKGTSIPIKFN
jgi:hypothetical protein